ncbi:hypothetical protein [Streptomyces eurythermus]|uniref:hypothetical protein n=1 Tax=Streptomyces eurythermus TaxID=42237 RepID=UPI0036D336E9
MAVVRRLGGPQPHISAREEYGEPDGRAVSREPLALRLVRAGRRLGADVSAVGHLRFGGFYRPLQ